MAIQSPSLEIASGSPVRVTPAARSRGYWESVARRLRRDPVTLVCGGILFMIVYYSCTGIILVTLGSFEKANTWIAAMFIPSAAFNLDLDTWSTLQSRWLIALGLLLAQSLVFAWLQRCELKDLAAQHPTVVHSTL